jgi:phosphate transport system substrate-binding protein
MPGSPFPSQPHQEFLTIRISKLTVVNGLLAVIVVVALVALGFRERAKSQAALASALVGSQPHEPAVVSRPPAPDRPHGPRAEAIAAKPADPLPPVESQAPDEGAVAASDPRPPETTRVELRPNQVIYREPPAADSLPTQPEVKPEDPPQPADQPDQPAAPTPPTPNPPPPHAASSSSPTILNGAGATYPYPLYSKWFGDYYKLNPGIQINYQPVGSGGGVRELLDGVVDFGATDVPTFNEQLSQSKTPILHIPSALGAVVPIYNIAGANREVMFTPEVLAGIFLGRIVLWNDPAIADVNRAVNLPNLPIVVIHRADGNAATFIFTEYLSKVSPNWQKQVGKGTSVNWPVGFGAKGNEGVAGMMRQTPGAIGYVDLLYAEQNHVPFGSVSNAAGNFVKASFRSVMEAAASVTELPPNTGLSIPMLPARALIPLPVLPGFWCLENCKIQPKPRIWQHSSAGRLLMASAWLKISAMRRYPAKLLPRYLKSSRNSVEQLFYPVNTILYKLQSIDAGELFLTFVHPVAAPPY